MRKEVEAVWKIEQQVHTACWNWKGRKQVGQVDSAKQSANRGLMAASIQIKHQLPKNHSLVAFREMYPLFWLSAPDFNDP